MAKKLFEGISLLTADELRSYAKWDSHQRRNAVSSAFGRAYSECVKLGDLNKPDPRMVANVLPGTHALRGDE